MDTITKAQAEEVTRLVTFYATDADAGTLTRLAVRPATPYDLAGVPDSAYAIEVDEINDCDNENSGLLVIGANGALLHHVADGVAQ